MHKVQVTRPDNSRLTVDVDAPNQRDAINCAIAQVVGEDGMVIDSSSVSKTAAMYPQYTAKLK